MAQLQTQYQDVPATNSTPITSDEFNELLRLRGQVGALRAQTNQMAQLQAQNQQMREAFAQLAPQKQQASDPLDAQQQSFTILQLNTAKQATLGMIIYAGEHRDEFPTNFSQTLPYYEDKNSEVSTNLSQFEMVFQSSHAHIANPASAIVVRSVQPFISKGKWAKAYGFADGHAEVHTEATGNFADWEQQHVPVLKNQ